MQAYLVHCTDHDLIVIPDANQVVLVDADKFPHFLRADPDWSTLAIDRMQIIQFGIRSPGVPYDPHRLAPSDYGAVVAIRDADTITIVDAHLWDDRLAFYNV